MLEFDFLRTADGAKRILQNFPLPAIVVDRAFRVYWSNDLAKKTYPYLTAEDGVQRLLAGLDTVRLLRELEETGNCTISDAIPMSGLHLSFSPIGGEAVIGAVAFLMEADAGAPVGITATHTATALSTGIRKSVEEMFSVMDTAAHKVDILGMGWVKPNFEHIGYFAYRILRIADNIAEFSSYQCGTMDVQPEVLDLFAFLRELGAAAELLPGADGLPVSFHLPEDETALVGMDRRKFELALLNVVHNALYYTRPGNQVRVDAWREGRIIYIRIADRGLGIPAAALPQVFRPYFSFDHSGKNTTTGLGLTMAKIILEAHGGEILIDSVERAGTTVTIRLEESSFSKRITLGQTDRQYRLADRFSPVYTGLYDTLASPYR